MKLATLKATLERAWACSSYNRPSVSDDNPYVESLFGTMKAGVGCSKQPFDSLTAAQQWVDSFVHWYNHEHRHSALNWSGQRLDITGEERKLLRRRLETYR